MFSGVLTGLIKIKMILWDLEYCVILQVINGFLSYKLLNVFSLNKVQFCRPIKGNVPRDMYTCRGMRFIVM